MVVFLYQGKLFMEEMNVENETFVERLNKYEVNNIIDFLFEVTSI